jgi:hypothetical protein
MVGIILLTNPLESYSAFLKRGVTEHFTTLLRGISADIVMNSLSDGITGRLRRVCGQSALSRG